ncbi:methyltransferase domain-containing protein [Arcobacter arenosus]|uniref:Methyltransferase domain-containing protein n=1 Tax=Arcobacter arenosus TaxID=2576037 RepID=A0A5R8Y539_9BACT|nr:methyltransferase domain-containing protein [Arcobacter arenosus]TLP40783.1 methyltransferase domain-containing protein [Arcobacter arenosus]
METQFNIKYALKKANAFQKSGLLTLAIEKYKYILKKDDSSFEAYFKLGDCFRINKDYNNALMYLKKATKINNKCYICHFKMSQIYEKLSKYEFSLFHLEKVTKICPDFYDALYSIAQCYRKMKNENKMTEFLNKTIEKIPEHPGANHLLASLNKETNSDYSSEYARDLFDRYADYFEEHLVNSLKYKVPNIIKEKLKPLNLSNNSKVLDLGCGTGLMGKTIVDIFPNLVGVDISSKMINETRKKEIYNKLYTNDINDFLFKNLDYFDLIIAADVFIYLGELENIFTCVKKSLNKNGYFIFTTEILNNVNKENYQLAKTGRFSHSIKYIESLIKKSEFELINKEEIILREENKIGQKGIVFTLKSISYFK